MKGLSREKLSPGLAAGQFISPLLAASPSCVVLRKLEPRPNVASRKLAHLGVRGETATANQSTLPEPGTSSTVFLLSTRFWFFFSRRLSQCNSRLGSGKKCRPWFYLRLQREAGTMTISGQGVGAYSGVWSSALPGKGVAAGHTGFADTHPRPVGCCTNYARAVHGGAPGTKCSSQEPLSHALLRATAALSAPPLASSSPA
jgi:hypothetical protein